MTEPVTSSLPLVQQGMYENSENSPVVLTVLHEDLDKSKKKGDLVDKMAPIPYDYFPVSSSTPRYPDNEVHLGSGSGEHSSASLPHPRVHDSGKDAGDRTSTEATLSDASNRPILSVLSENKNLSECLLEH